MNYWRSEMRKKKDQQNTSSNYLRALDSTDTKSPSHVVYLTSGW